jgi:putative FmdB family regulatory protein
MTSFTDETTMPTYEYRCPEGHEFEQFQRMSDPPGANCPRCGAAAERLLSAGAGLIFRGSGFYLTDYRSDSYKKAAEADGQVAGGAASSSESSGSAKIAGNGPSGEKPASSKPAAPAADAGGGNGARA